MSAPIYLDNAATTQPAPEVIAAMRELLEANWGNPSSAHVRGANAKRTLNEARAAISALAGCETDEVYFTSGGTEADNWAVSGVLELSGAKNHWITVATEHHAIYDLAAWWRQRGGSVTLLTPDRTGLITPRQVAEAITESTALVSVMHVNNELGVLQPVAELAALCRNRGVLFHTDAVQSFGKLRFSFRALGADLMSISAHKIYGPKGTGGLLIKRGTRIAPRQIGGGQERGLRPGTENIAGIVGFGKAAELCAAQLEHDIAHTRRLRDQLEERIFANIADVQLNGSREHRAPGILNVAFPGCEGEALLIALDRKGFCVSTGSACSAGALGASHVLLGIGLDVAVAQSSLRFSFGRYNREAEVDALMNVLPSIVDKQRQLAPAGLR